VLVLANLGDAYYQQNEWKDAEAALAEARLHWNALYDKNPGEHRADFALTLMKLGDTFSELGRRNEAKSTFGKALEITVSVLPWKRERNKEDWCSSDYAYSHAHEDSRVLRLRWSVISLWAQMLATKDWDAARRSLEKGLEEVSRCRAYIPSYAERVRFQRETATHRLLETMQRLSIEARDRETAFRWSGARGHALAELAATVRAQRDRVEHSI